MKAMYQSALFRNQMIKEKLMESIEYSYNGESDYYRILGKLEMAYELGMLRTMDFESMKELIYDMIFAGYAQ